MNVMDYARNTEESGIRFYQEMADSTENEGVKRIFSRLAHDEEILLEKLQRLQQRHPEMGRQNIRSLNRRINAFEKLRKKRGKFSIASDVDAYRLACDAESEIVKTYEKVTKSAQATEAKKALMRIMAMERHELTDIENLLAFTEVPDQSLVWGEFSNIDEFHDFGRYGQP